jgi:hypothetical protein
MTTTIDRMIKSDLAELATDTRRDLPEQRDAGVYRDGTAGAQARRDVLAEERRLQLALMPLAIAQVFAHRVARAAAGTAALLCSLALVAFLADPLLMRVVAWLVPGVGINIGTCVMIASTVILVTYVGATWAAEAWFTKKMREAVATDHDIYADLDKLAKGPIEVAQKLVRKVDGWSIGLAVAGAAALISVFGYLVVIAGAFQPLSHVLSTTSLFAERAAAGNLGPVVYAIAMAVGAAFVIARGCEREGRIGELPPLVARLAHWSTLAIAVVVGLGVMFATARMVTHLQFRLPAPGHRYLLAIGGKAALLGVTAWLALWWRRRERARLGD